MSPTKHTPRERIRNDMTAENQVIRAVAYTRVSTKREQQDKSYNNQKRYYEFFCKQEGYKLIETYGDKGSGTNASRKEFLNMLYDAGIDANQIKGTKDYDYYISEIRKPLFDLIICKDPSRFARNASEGMTLVKRLRKVGVHIYFESRDKSTADADNDDQINQWFLNGESESRATSRRIKTTLRYNREEEIYTTGALPYALYRDENGDIAVDDEQAKVVVEVFELSKTLGQRRIAQILNERGYKTRTGAKWGASQVRAMQKNTLYYGKAMIGKTEVKALTEYPKPVDISEQTPIENVCTPIISKTEFDEVQEILERRVSTRKDGKKKGVNIAKEEDIFSKKIRCAKCGGVFTRASKPYKVKNGEKKVYYYYYCLRRNKSKACDNDRHVPFNTLKKAVTMVEPQLIFGDKGMGASILKIVDQLKGNYQKIAEEYQSKINENLKLITEKSQVITKLEMIEVIKVIESEMNELLKENKELQQKVDALKLDNLERIIQQVHERELEMERLSKSFTDEDKLKMVSEVKVNGYEYTFWFDVPNFNDIINELNSFVSTTLEADTILEDIFNEHRVVEQNKTLTIAY